MTNPSKHFITDSVARHNSKAIYKLVNDTLIVGRITDGNEKADRREIAQLVEWCHFNNLALSVSKTKEMIVDFRRKSGEGDPVLLEGSVMERVNVSEDLSWRLHIDAVTRKAHQRLYFVRCSEEICYITEDSCKLPRWRAFWLVASLIGYGGANWQGYNKLQRRGRVRSWGWRNLATVEQQPLTFINNYSVWAGSHRSTGQESESPRRQCVRVTRSGAGQPKRARDPRCGLAGSPQKRPRFNEHTGVMSLCRLAYHKLAPVAQISFSPRLLGKVARNGSIRQISSGGHSGSSGETMMYALVIGGVIAGAGLYTYKVLHTDKARYNDRITEIMERPKKEWTPKEKESGEEQSLEAVEAGEEASAAESVKQPAGRSTVEPNEEKSPEEEEVIQVLSPSTSDDSQSPEELEACEETLESVAVEVEVPVALSVEQIENPPTGVEPDKMPLETEAVTPDEQTQ
ncbi:uncharacterized protein mgarpa [Narcine bancroftii]|uniref:uncharacterized protein mgarpa n=1 Tax=Narcine bancroftii TaxID=1343680 RepID=UPI0038320864